MTFLVQVKKGKQFCETKGEWDDVRDFVKQMLYHDFVVTILPIPDQEESTDA